MDLLCATTNKSKLVEFQRITKRLTSKRGSDEHFRILATPYKMLYSDELCGYDIHITPPPRPLPDVEETGLSLYENAGIKARTAFDILKCPVFANDSGIWVDGIGGPGVFTGRYDANSSFKKVIEQLCTVHSTGGILATLTSVICLITADAKEHYFSGSIHGVIDTAIHKSTLDGDYIDWKQVFVHNIGFVRDCPLNSIYSILPLADLDQCVYDDICHHHNSLYEMLMYLKKKGDI